MDISWKDDNSSGGAQATGLILDGGRCPLTNKEKCEVLSNGWQPQELCHALQCSQLKFLEPQNKTEAA